MEPERRLPWRVPATMVAGLLGALLLAVGHHLFYSHLHHRTVSAQSWKIGAWSATSQQLNIAGGTAFAFVFKAALTLATSMAYFQLLFQVVSNTKCKLGKLDHLFSGLTDLTSLAHLVTYYKYWLLTSTAFITWLLPLAAIFAPAALTVAFEKLPTSSSPEPIIVPQVAFESLALGEWTTNTYKSEIAFEPVGAAMDVTRTAVAAAAGGYILPIAPPVVNATWQMTIELPRLLCDSIATEEETFQNMEDNLLKVLTHHTTLNQTTTGAMFTYISYVGLPNTVPFGPLESNGWPLRTYTGASDLLSVPSQDLYVGVFDKANDPSFSNLGLNLTVFNDIFASGTLLRCALDAANYSLAFTYNGTDQAQNIEVQSIESISMRAGIVGPAYDTLEIFPGNSGPTFNFCDDSTRCPRRMLRNFSYYFLWQAFTALVMGTSNGGAYSSNGGAYNNPGQGSIFVCEDVGDGGCPGYSQEIPTQIFTTSLRETSELFPLLALSPLSSFPKPTGMADGAWEQLRNFTDGMEPQPRVNKFARKSLQEGLEELFFNITISMASLASLRYNESSIFAPPKVQVTSNRYGNLYVYNPAKLWLPYGIALGMALLDVLIGLWIIWKSGASFSAEFSTIFRIAKNSTLGDVETYEPHLPGKDPLPAKLSDAVLSSVNIGLVTYGGDSQGYVPVEQSADEGQSVRVSSSKKRFNKTSQGV